MDILQQCELMEILGYHEASAAWVAMICSDSGHYAARIEESVARELYPDMDLDALATKTGVSRSMISLIERGESSPTAAVLEKLAAGLGDAGLAVRPAGRRVQRPGVRASRSGKTRPRATVGATSRRRVCRSRCR